MTHDHPLPAARRRPTMKPLPWQRFMFICLAVAGPATGQTPPVQAAADIAQFFTSPGELRDELATHEVLPNLFTGFELIGHSEHEKQVSWAQDNFVDVSGALRWEPRRNIEFSYEATFEFGRPQRDFAGAGCEYSQHCILQEAIVTFSNIAATSWYVTLGHTEVPFGKYVSWFRERPATRFLGETLASEVALGYESQRMDLEFAAFEVNSGPRTFAGKLTFHPLENIDIGLSWTSDLMQSLEIKRVVQEALQPGPGLPSPGIAESAVQGAGTFLSARRDGYTVDIEYIATLDNFEPGLIADGVVKPWTWNLEFAKRLSDRWQIGARLARSSNVPESPDRQYGVVTSFGINRYSAVSVEYLHNHFAGASDQEQVSAALLLRW